MAPLAQDGHIGSRVWRRSGSKLSMHELRLDTSTKQRIEASSMNWFSKEEALWMAEGKVSRGVASLAESYVAGSPRLFILYCA